MFDSGAYSFQMLRTWFTVYQAVKRECRLIGENSHDVKTVFFKIDCEMIGLIHTARLWGVNAYIPISMGVIMISLIMVCES